MESFDQNLAPRCVRIDLSEIANAFIMGTEESSVYLDLEAGEVIFQSSEIRSVWERIAEELPEDLPDDDDARDAAIEAAAEGKNDIPEWMVEVLQEAARIEADDGTRYILIPRLPSSESYEHMKAFVETVPNDGLQEQLWKAIEGRGAFRRFKDVLLGYPAERDRWFKFEEAKMLERAREWLADEGIEAIYDAETS